MEDLNKVHIWIGNTTQTENQYYKYFELDYSIEDLDDPEYKVCQFCQDIGERWYDEDFSIFPPPLDDAIPIKELLNLIDIDTNDIDLVIKQCNLLNIEKANAIFSYNITKRSELSIKTPHKDNYNGLKYIGLYNY